MTLRKVEPLHSQSMHGDRKRRRFYAAGLIGTAISITQRCSHRLSPRLVASRSLATSRLPNYKFHMLDDFTAIAALHRRPREAALRRQRNDGRRRQAAAADRSARPNAQLGLRHRHTCSRHRLCAARRRRRAAPRVDAGRAPCRAMPALGWLALKLQLHHQTFKILSRCRQVPGTRARAQASTSLPAGGRRVIAQGRACH